VGDQCAPRRAEYVEELAQGGPVAARCGPQQPTGVVVDDDGQLAVPALVGDLVDTDPGQPVRAVTEGFDVGPDAGDDRTDGAPGDAHQVRDRGLRTLGHQPGDGLVEGERVTRAVACPRHVRDDNPVLGATDPRRIGLEEHPRRAGIQRPPATPSLAAVVTPAATPAHPAPASSAPRRSYSSHQQLLDLVEQHHSLTPHPVKTTYTTRRDATVAAERTPTM
jgi:hypothetical protein